MTLNSPRERGAGIKTKVMGLSGGLGFAAALVFLLGCAQGKPLPSEAYIALNLTVTQTNFRSVADTWSARCIFGQAKWRIESHFARNGVDYFYCDGTNVYTRAGITGRPASHPSILEHFKSDRVTGAADLPDAADPVILSIVPGIHPLSDTGGNLPWLAYCSGSYIRLTNQLMPLIAAIVRHDPSSFAFERQEEIFPDDWGLPRKLSLLCSEKLLRKSPSDVRLLRTDEQVRSARIGGGGGERMMDGMLAARYTVLRSTNIAGRTIPTVFTYEQFVLGSNTLIPFLVATGIATNIHLAQEPQSIISPAQSYTAVDFRFRSREKILDEIVYPITNGVVPAMSSPRLRLLFRQTEMSAVVDPFQEVGKQ